MGPLKLRYYLLVFFYCAVIFWLSAQQHLPYMNVRFPGEDKVVHLVLYGGLAAAVSLGLRRSENKVSRRVQFLVPVVFAALYGLSDEIHQYFVPNRWFDPLDLAANTFGAVLAQLLLCYVLWKQPARDSAADA